MKKLLLIVFLMNSTHLQEYLIQDNLANE